jgi:hypothetical protein
MGDRDIVVTLSLTSVWAENTKKDKGSRPSRRHTGCQCWRRKIPCAVDVTVPQFNIPIWQTILTWSQYVAVRPPRLMDTGVAFAVFTPGEDESHLPILRHFLTLPALLAAWH